MGANGIYGLSGSGLDIESLVKMGMMKKQNQYDKMYQQQVQHRHQYADGRNFEDQINIHFRPSQQ